MEKLDASRLPKNIEAEQALIGAVLANNKAYEKISEFYQRHRMFVIFGHFNFMH